jgi:hypothetical protein
MEFRRSLHSLALLFRCPLATHSLATHSLATHSLATHSLATHSLARDSTNAETRKRHEVSSGGRGLRGNRSLAGP